MEGESQHHGSFLALHYTNTAQKHGITYSTSCVQVSILFTSQGDTGTGVKGISKPAASPTFPPAQKAQLPQPSPTHLQSLQKGHTTSGSLKAMQGSMKPAALENSPT